MSATNRSEEPRDPFDSYPTPAWCVEWLLRAWPQRGGRVLEPAAGDGSLIAAAKAAGWDNARWTAVEIQAHLANALEAREGFDSVVVYHSDFLKLPVPLSAPFDVAITNPPYAHAEEFVRHALKFAPVVCMLLRLNFLGSLKRAAWMKANPPDVYVLARRPSFRKSAKGSSTDSCEYAWMVWDREDKRAMGEWTVIYDPAAAEAAVRKGARRG